MVTNTLAYYAMVLTALAKKFYSISPGIEFHMNFAKSVFEKKVFFKDDFCLEGIQVFII
jgi:hypothetical protein